MAHVDRWAVLLQRALDDLDGTHDAGAKTARLGEMTFINDLQAGAELRRLGRKCRGRPPPCSLSNTLATTP